jgi:uncharacterized protein (UPF0332 family)
MNAWNLSQRLQLQTHACVTQKFKKQIKQEFKKNNQKINQKNQKLNLARNQNSKIKTKKIEKTMVSLIVIKIRCSG